MRDHVTTLLKAPPATDVVQMAVRTILTRGVARTQLANDLGIGVPTLDRWVRNAIDLSPFGDVLENLFNEVGALRQENAELRRIVSGRKPRVAGGT